MKVAEFDNNIQLAEQAKTAIMKIWTEIKTKPDVTAYETLNYLNLNEGKTVWTDYNKTIRDQFPDDYNDIFNRSEEYKKAHPEITQFSGVKS